MKSYFLLIALSPIFGLQLFAQKDCGKLETLFAGKSGSFSLERSLIITQGGLTAVMEKCPEPEYKIISWKVDLNIAGTSALVGGQGSLFEEAILEMISLCEDGDVLHFLEVKARTGDGELISAQDVIVTVEDKNGGNKVAVANKNKAMASRYVGKWKVTYDDGTIDYFKIVKTGKEDISVQVFSDPSFKIAGTIHMYTYTGVLLMKRNDAKIVIKWENDNKLLMTSNTLRNIFVRIK